MTYKVNMYKKLFIFSFLKPPRGRLAHAKRNPRGISLCKVFLTFLHSLFYPTASCRECTSLCMFILMVAIAGGLQHPASAQSGRTVDTLISGRIVGADTGGPLAGVILIEAGRLFGKKYQYGGAVNEKGEFSIKVLEGGDYGLHVYASGYIYLPLAVSVQTGEDTQYTFTLPPNPALKDAPVISNISFNPVGGKTGQTMIKLSVHDPNHNLSHQVLGVNTRTQEGFVFKSKKFIMPWKKDFPDGDYTITYNTGGQPFNQQEWYFVAADNRCYNSSVLRHPFTDEGVVVASVPPADDRSSSPVTAEQAAKMGEKHLLKLGSKLFIANCMVCHLYDSTATKVGPGLKGLYSRKVTPSLKRPVTDENISSQLHKGSGKMPPYAHIRGGALASLLAYMKSL